MKQATIVLLLFTLSACTIFNKAKREERRKEKLENKISAAVLLLKKEKRLADSCAINYPCVGGDSTITFDSTFYINSYNDMQELVMNLADAQDSLINELMTRDTSCIEVIKRIQDHYNYKDKLLSEKIKSIQPVVKQVVVEVEDNARLEMMENYFEDSLQRMRSRYDATYEELIKERNRADLYQNRFKDTRRERNWLFFICLGIVLGAGAVTFAKIKMPSIGLFK